MASTKTHRERLSDATPPSATAAGLACLDRRRKNQHARPIDGGFGGVNRAPNMMGGRAWRRENHQVSQPPSLKVVHTHVRLASHEGKRNKEPRNIACDPLSLVVETKRFPFLFCFVVLALPAS